MNSRDWDKRIKNVDNLRDAVWCTGMFVKHETMVREFLALWANKRVLDVGCGWGRFATCFSPEQYVGIDFSKKMIDEAKKRYPEYTFKVADKQELNGNGFDVVFEVISLSSLGMTEKTFADQFRDAPLVAMFQPEGLRVVTNLGRDTDAEKIIYDRYHKIYRFVKATDPQILTTLMRQVEQETEYFGRHRGEDPCVFRDTEYGWFLYDDDKVIGYVFYEVLNDTDASYGRVLLEEYKGHGLGRRMLSKVIHEAKQHGLKKLIGHIEKTNWKSVWSNFSLGFKLVNEDDTLVRVEKTL